MLPSRKLLLLEIAFFLGVILRSLVKVPEVFFVLCAVCALFLAVIPIRNARALFLFPLAIQFGIMRMEATETPAYQGTLQQMNGSIATLDGRIVAEPDVRIDQTKIIVAIHHAVTPPHNSIRGRVLITLPLYPEYAYGDTLLISCALVAPERINTFRYDEYLAVQRIYSLCRKPKILSVVHSPHRSIHSVLFAFKNRLQSRINTLYPEPHGALLTGLIIGARSSLPDSVMQAFQRAGLSHIVALSGFNVTIIVASLSGVLQKLRLHRYGTLWVIGITIMLFVLMTGAASSIVRAAVMGILVLFSKRLGRRSNLWYALVFAATVMVLWNPRILLHDIGFQLSFLATIGLVAFSEKWKAFLHWLPESFGIREAATATLAASTTTLPIMALQFGRIPLMSPLANILVLPLVPLTMLVGFLSVAIPIFGQVLFPATALLLSWILFVPASLTNNGWASFTVPHIWAVGGAVLYASSLGILLWRWNRKVPQQ